MIFCWKDPFYTDSLLLINSAKKAGKTLLISSLSIANINYFAVKMHGVEKARTGIDYLIKQFDISSVNSDTVRQAHLAKWKDFEDAIQYHSALAAEADLIVTRDIAGYEEQKVKVEKPVEALKLL